MLLKLHNAVEESSASRIKIKKYANGEDASDKGAFSLDTLLRFEAHMPRRLGVRSIALRINRDGEESYDIPLVFEHTRGGTDVYSTEILFDEKNCHGKDGLFYYEFVLLRGFDTLFTNSINNLDFSLENCQKNKFRLLIYKSDYTVPKWFSGGVMYQIFVDRFFKGEGSVGERDDVIINPDWYNGIPQFAKNNGDRLANNMFFGGNLWGVAEKLDYLSSLGVSVIYLNPIFKAYSNHKYDTGDYMCIDEMFGGMAAFENLVKKASEYGIRVILDGVFNHTGDDSRYFNKYGKYDSVGAYQSVESEYRDWFCFDGSGNYESWWGIDILPKLNPSSKACRNFLAGRGGVVDKYMRLGIGGFRLDVADELSDEMLDMIRETVKSASDGEGIVIGEVWENAADKISYGKRRRYLRGDQLDSVMNYPLRNAILSLISNQNSEEFYNTVTELYSSYPRFVCDSLMNIVGTHDTERILTRLGTDAIASMSNEELSRFHLSQQECENAVKRLKVASVLQFTVFGVPSIYYGDEAGVEGGHDPFCRITFPWGRENSELLAHYRALGKIRNENCELKHGVFRFIAHHNGFVAFERCNERCEGEKIITLANCGGDTAIFALPEGQRFLDLLDGGEYLGEINVAPMSAMILKAM